MLNEDRIQVMTKLAILEDENGKDIETASKYFVKDYICYHMIWTTVSTTCAYLLLILLGVFYKLEFFLTTTHKLNLLEVGRNLLLVYILFLACFELLAFFIYKKKFEYSQRNLKKYCATLHELEKLYNQERPGTVHGAGGKEI